MLPVIPMARAGDEWLMMPVIGDDVGKLGQYEEMLARARLFQDLPASVLAEVARRVRLSWFSDGAFVFLEGYRAEAVHLLAEGRIKIVRETTDGREVILRMIHPGEIFGGAGGWGAERYPASAVSLGDSVVMRIPAVDFTELITRHSEFALAIIHELSARLREAEARIQALQTERVERRIARTLLRLAGKTGVRGPRGLEIGMPLSRQNLAELAGTTLSTASRVLSGWDRDGLLIAERERVIIVRPHDLVVIADDLSAPEDGDQLT